MRELYTRHGNILTGRVKGYNWLAVFFTREDLEKYMDKARREAARYVENTLYAHGAPDFFVEIAKNAVLAGKADSFDVIDRAREEGVIDYVDEYIPTVEDIAVSLLLTQILRDVAGMNLEATPFENEPLPGLSIYLGSDIRGFRGRWTWSEAGDNNICFALITDEEACEKLTDILQEIETEARRNGLLYAFAVWTR